MLTLGSLTVDLYDGHDDAGLRHSVAVGRRHHQGVGVPGLPVQWPRHIHGPRAGHGQLAPGGKGGG